MQTKWKFVRIFMVLAFLVTFLPLHTSVASAAPLASIPPGHSDRILRVKLVEGTVSDLGELLTPELQALVQKIDPLFTLPRSKLKELKDTGDEKLKKEKGESVQLLPDLGLWYEVKLVPGSDMAAAVTAFQAIPEVEDAGSAPLLTEPPATPDFSGQQGYLASATNGVDAQYAWSVAGGTGEGVTIYDVEYGWLQTHEDLSKARNVSLLLNPGDSPSNPYGTDHGTAVLGEMIADKDNKGVTGIAHGANVGLAPANTTNLGWNPANAIMLAVNDGQPGDVILIEQQAPVCGLSSYGPMEGNNDVYSAIRTAVANGFVVVEAAGNDGAGKGGVNLDQSGCGTTFNRTLRDSGATLVGAGKPPSSGADRERWVDGIWASSYGNRVDVQGWGSGIMTTGVGDYYTADDWFDETYYYTNTFSGTSGASPMVAAAAAIIQGVAKVKNGSPLSPWQVRDLLVQTGSPQLGNTAEHIGPRPNLRQAIALLPQSATTIVVTDNGNGSDGVCGVGNCTLREAIAAANARGSATTIELTATTTYTLSTIDNTDATNGANGLPVITGNITINAHGAIIERSTATGTSNFRLFQVASGGNLSLKQATLRNGKLSSGSGAALLNLGTALVSGSTVTGNSATNGAAFTNRGTLTLVSSTLTNNSASSNGGAIQDSGTLTILGSTIAGNSAASGASLYTTASPLVKNTILVKGTSGANCSGTGTLASASITNLADDSSCGSSAMVKTAAGINLGTLAANGGPTQTMALRSPSAAIEAGNASACKDTRVNDRDQRDYSRFADGNSDSIKSCDIGAYEYLSVYLPPSPPAPETNPPRVRVVSDPTAPDGSNGWYRKTVSLDVQASDTSGVIEVRCALDPATPPSVYTDLPETACLYVGGADVSTDGSHTLYAAAMDLYENVSTLYSFSFQLDATPPVLTCPAGGPFLLKSNPPTIGPAGLDASVSGLDEAASTLSGSVATDTIGSKSLTFTAYDLAGNSASKQCTYTVIYDFGGTYPPVAPAPFINPAAIGSAVSVKFSLDGYQGMAILATGYPKSQKVDCTTLEPLGPLQGTSPAGKSGLSYDKLTSWYNYVWKTDKAWAGTCRALIIGLIDGTEHVAYFQLK